MSRLYPTVNNFNNDILTNCDGYLSRILKPRRVEKPRVEQRNLREKPVVGNQLVVSRPVVKPSPAPIAKIEKSQRQPSTQELVHKEVFNNNMATVEVTVRTLAQKGSGVNKNASERQREREPWGQILKRKSEESIQGSFVNFDPLRTLHFLSKELQFKMQKLCPNDPSVQQIMNDMQKAMQRLPPEVISQLKYSELDVNKQSCSGDMEANYFTKSNNYIDKKQVSKQCQTVIIGDAETKRIKQVLEESASKLEANYKVMESACNKLRDERDELESKLLSEKETVKLMRNELQASVLEKETAMTKVVDERDSLRLQVKDLLTQMEAQEEKTAEDLRKLIQEVQNKQLTTEEDNATLRNELTIMKLEKDKMNVLLDCRDKQLRELQKELDTIEQLVSLQFIELKTIPPCSAATSLSSVSQFWNMPSSARSQRLDKSIHEIFLSNDVMNKMIANKELQIDISDTSTVMNVDSDNKFKNMKLFKDDQAIPLRDKPESQMTLSDAGISTGQDYNIPKNSHSSIKNTFAEIKRQAFQKTDVTLLQPPRPFKEASSVNSNTSDTS